MTWINLAYLVASVLFIFGIKGMTHPRTAVRGNLLGASGMLLATVAACFHLGVMQHGANYGWGEAINGFILVFAGILVGSTIGILLAVKVQMTGMPQLVGLFNGFGGAASLLVGWVEMIQYANKWRDLTDIGDTVGVAISRDWLFLIAALFAGLIGTVTLTGSLVAAGKLQEFKIFKNPITMGTPGQQIFNAALLVVCLVLGMLMIAMPGLGWLWFTLLVLVAGVLGLTLTLPIGGADMPVVIALLNSYSGLAAAATGFVIANNVLIIAGSLVGASGLILTAIMCKAMNRSLANVLFGKIDASAATSTDEIYEGKIKRTSGDEVAMMLDGVQRVAVVPGYGMAVAQAQGAVKNLFDELEQRGVRVDFAIHPVAGRMPGHMNVLLAEADIPYDRLIEMDQINPEFPQIDMAIVLGANDVVNPDARKADSPIAGMPILNVDEARTVVVIKRSLSPGFAGIPNPLFANDNTLMFFSDGKKAIEEIVSGVKEL